MKKAEIVIGSSRSIITVTSAPLLKAIQKPCR